jgi:3-oxoacyl-[acyl-carrier protein] reductase
VVNNAGIGTMSPVASQSEDDYEKVFAVNVRGVLFSCQEAARRLEDGGRIVNISSSLSVAPEAGLAVYCASKAAVNTLTQVLARELGARNITVNSVLPGPTLPGCSHQCHPKCRKRRRRLRRSVAWAAPRTSPTSWRFLCSDEARWLSGQSLHATGGAA